MDLPSKSEGATRFNTNVGLITSFGPIGHNIMAAEWTHQISYSPGMIAICLQQKDATNKNILESKYFGVNLATTEQNTVASISGQSTGTEVDKIKLLQEMGYKFSPAEKIENLLMLDEAALMAECQLVFHQTFGTHTMYIGEVVNYKVNLEHEPLVYHAGKYWKLTESLHRPPQDILDKIDLLKEKNRR